MLICQNCQYGAVLRRYPDTSDISIQPAESASYLVCLVTIYHADLLVLGRMRGCLQI